MDDKRIDKAAAFDTLFTSNRIQILKILAYYMDPRLLKGLAVYIKMSELQYTLTLFRRHPETSLCIAPSSVNEETATELCNDLMPLCDETQKSALRQITQMMDNIHNFQEMMEMVQTMQELFPEGFSDLSGMDPSMLSGLFPLQNQTQEVRKMDYSKTPLWMQDDLVKDIPREKLDFLSKLFAQGHGKSQKEMMALLMPAMRKAKLEHLTFTTQEMQAAITAIKKYSTESELRQIENILEKSRSQKITPGRLNVCQELFYSTFSQRHSQSRVITLSITT